MLEEHMFCKTEHMFSQKPVQSKLYIKFILIVSLHFLGL